VLADAALSKKRNCSMPLLLTINNGILTLISSVLWSDKDAMDDSAGNMK